MKILKGIGIALLVILAILVVGGYMQPRYYHVERSRTIAATVPELQAQITDLRRWQTWNPWAAHDTDMQVSYGTPSSGLGAHYSWKSEQAGDGALTIDHISPDSVCQQLDFGFGAENPRATFHFRPEGSATQVRWAMRGDLGSNPFTRWYGLMMEPFVGKDYEQGLANLANAVEKK